MKSIAFIDIEVSNTNQILDIGGIRDFKTQFHQNSISELSSFLNGVNYLAGHNIVQHDWEYLKGKLSGFYDFKLIDTLYLSPLLFPRKPYHRLIKDDQLYKDELNNPLNDAIQSQTVFQDEMDAFHKLDVDFQQILYLLLQQQVGFSGFFDYISFQSPSSNLPELILKSFSKLICNQIDLNAIIRNNPIELAYALALIHIRHNVSITPPWVLNAFPKINGIIHKLTNHPCLTGCSYCNEKLDATKGLKTFFGFDQFRIFDGEPLQEKGVDLAINDRSLLAIFPTGGGKSLTFQVPALIGGRNESGLTIVISPLQSLMKDQVDNLEKSGITQAVTINGLLDPIERAKAIERVENGSAWILYISPESLRSKTILNLMLKRKIIRFVIDEAHCFSAWGQDFRVDYLYIGDFIRKLQTLKQLDYKIPVSCFTATAKQKVIADIKAYFKEKLSLDLALIQSSTSRTNLHYDVSNQQNENEKYQTLRELIEAKNCPTIVYVSRTRKAFDLAERLTKDGLIAKPYHGKMPAKEKTKNQNDFINGDVQIMVATSAFGMGVDKKDVKLVVHYQISSSLENYVQEAGRAGRDPNIEADCYILYNDEDLHKHFVLLNQTKLHIHEIQQIWKSIKLLTKSKSKISSSALEIARKAGWNDTVLDLETKVKTAINALEQSGYLKRTENAPRIYANSIAVKKAQDAIDIINQSPSFNPKQRVNAIRIIKKLFASKQQSKLDDDAETRIDYIADHLGIVKREVIDAIMLMRKENILAHDHDLLAFFKKGASQKQIINLAANYAKIENFIQLQLKNHDEIFHLKEWNEQALMDGIEDFDLHKVKNILNLWAVQGWIKKSNISASNHHLKIISLIRPKKMKEKLERKHHIIYFVVSYLHEKYTLQKQQNENETAIGFSIVELEKAYIHEYPLFNKIDLRDIEDSLFYLSRIGAISLEGGFLVIYNRLTLERKEANNLINYKKADYQQLEQFYESKTQQIHIVGEYAKKMLQNYEEALLFVDDYFQLNYASFLNKYFNSAQIKDMSKSITPKKFKQLFGELTVAQLAVVKDNQSPKIAVLAGPGSGKTRILVHKLASLLLLEDVKFEQLLMLTFSRSAATEFKKRLYDLLGGGARFVEIRTFHSYCFHLLGKIGSIDHAQNIIKEATQKIIEKSIEISQITKTVLVIDEGQDINAEEFELIKAIAQFNQEMRIVIVGDDDQNIFTFRGSDTKYLKMFVHAKDSKTYELLDNFRSKNNLVLFTNGFVKKIKNRLKSMPIRAVQNKNGLVKIIKYPSSVLITPLVESLKNTELSGSTIVLTKTNEDAELTLGLLTQFQMKAKLIQSQDNFKLYDLQEIRFFITSIYTYQGSQYISKTAWQNAKRAVFQKYKSSPNFDLVKQLIIDFQETNPKTKLLTDLKIFIQESKMEDFFNADTELIYVSTMHKSKGKEFDNVILLLDHIDFQKETNQRLVYVAMTRAKNNLIIHTHSDFLDDIKGEGIVHIESSKKYKNPQQLVYHLTLKDVYLNHFKSSQIFISKLFAGMLLTPFPEGLGYNEKLIIKYSKHFSEEIAKKARMGYFPTKAFISQIVYWKDMDTVPETFTYLENGKMVSAAVDPEILVVLGEVWFG